MSGSGRWKAAWRRLLGKVLALDDPNQNPHLRAGLSASIAAWIVQVMT